MPALLCRFFVLGIVSKSRKVSAGVTRPRRNQVLQDQQANETLLRKARARARAQLTKGEPPPRPSRDTPRPRPGQQVQRAAHPCRYARCRGPASVDPTAPSCSLVA